MNFKDLLEDALPVIKNFAPTIATAIGGPMGAATGYAVKALADTFDAKPENIHDVCKNIITDPCACKKLSNLENDHKDFIQSLIGNFDDLSKAEISFKIEFDKDKDK